MEGVSVIICCYNSASRLKETLRHLSLQQTDDELRWEIIVVDNASTDNTKLVAEKLWNETGRADIKLKVVNQPVKGLSFARAKGIAESQFDTIIFCDDDNWLQPRYLRDAYIILKHNKDIGALGGTGIAVSDSALPDWFEQYRSCFACYPQGVSDGELDGVTSSLYGAGLVVRREALTRLSSKKYTPILTDRTGMSLASGGDTELCFALRLIGYKLWFSDKLKFYHYLPSSRLTESYLLRLNQSLSYCSKSLIVYNYVLTGKPVNRYVWLKDAVYQLYFFSLSLLRSLIVPGPSLERRLQLSFSLNSMKSIFRQFGKYRLRYDQIVKLKD